MSNTDTVNFDAQAEDDEDVILSVDDLDTDDEDVIILDDETDLDDAADESSLAVVSSGEHITVTQRDPDTGEIVERTVDLSLPPLNTNEAREITEQIKHQSNQLYVLVKRAHAGRAWEALGYTGFAEYVKKEFGTSTSWAYRLLSQANIIEAIEAKVPEGTRIELGEPVARSLKRVLPELLNDVEERTYGLDAGTASAVVGDVISDHLAELERQEQEDAEEQYEGQGGGTRDYDTPYNPDFEYPGGDDEDEEPEVQADRPDPAQLMALRKNLEGLFNLYSGLKSLADVGDAQTIIPHIRADRRNEFTSLLEIVVPWVADFQDQWLVYLQQVEAEERAALDEDDSLDELDEFDPDELDDENN